MNRVHRPSSLWDCDTTGVEPDLALVKFKKLAGGGYFKIINQSVPPALKALGYSSEQVEAIVRYATGAATLVGTPHINHQTLKTNTKNHHTFKTLQKHYFLKNN